MNNNAYNPQAVEQHWQARWYATGLYRASVDWSRPKHYAVTMLPYPSGNLHIGHWYAMTPSDAHARYMRMRGFNVLFPMGFDAFGLPAEQAAVTRGIHPATWTHSNVSTMRAQMRSMGAMFDWSREIISCDPPYYRWTEWFFRRFFEAGLAYRGTAVVNWSPTLQTVLANEQVVDGKDERTGQPVIQMPMEQWFFRITRYADELLSFDGLDWPEPVRQMQTNWVGRSEGASVRFAPADAPDATPIPVYTTRPDTLWGATFLVLAPEHAAVDALTSDQQRAAVEAYVARTARMTEQDRLADAADKTGVFTGGYAVNPATGARVQVWIADYVLASYGTGAIMAVPAHDPRDFAFARKFGLPIAPVIKPEGGAPLDPATMTDAYVGPGTIIHSGPLDGTPVSDGKGRANPSIAAAIDWVVAQRVGEATVNLRLRDWLISRQRYWGAPIPMVYPEGEAVQPVPADQFPVLLPEDVTFTGSGNPLAQHDAFVHTILPGGTPARRETDTMDTFLCSSWYQYGYLCPSTDTPFDPEEAAYWLPVDVYTGGAEHATMHLLYTRFFTKAMRDTGVFDQAAAIARAHGRDPRAFTDEPMMLLRNQGQILGEERSGDTLTIIGTPGADGRITADAVHVHNPEADATAQPAPTVDSGVVVHGELMDRVEGVLTVRQPDGTRVTVDVPGHASISIPHIPGDNSIVQLKVHLDVQRMSKSRGNVVDPDALVARYGSDAVRAYLMFGFDWAKGGPWNSDNISGVVRWLNDVWALVHGPAASGGDQAASAELVRAAHSAIRDVTAGLEAFSFNTAIAALMSLRNAMKSALRDGASAEAWTETLDILPRLMAPFTPHAAEALWERIGGPYSVHTQPWPTYDEARTAQVTVPLVVMVNGKVRDRLDVPAGISEDDAKARALATEVVQRATNGQPPRKVIYIAPTGGKAPEPKVNVVV